MVPVPNCPPNTGPGSTTETLVACSTLSFFTVTTYSIRSPALVNSPSDPTSVPVLVAVRLDDGIFTVAVAVLFDGSSEKSSGTVTVAVFTMSTALLVAVCMVT